MGCCSDSCCDWVFLAGPDMQTLTVAKRNPNTCIFESIGNIECWQSLIKMTLAFGAIHLPILTPHRKCTMQSYYNDLALINPLKKMEVGVQWEGFFALESIWYIATLQRRIIHTDTVNITVFRTVQLLWKVNHWISVDIPYRKTSKTWRQQVYVHVAIHRETTRRQ